jgi:hypothetical protein
LLLLVLDHLPLLVGHHLASPVGPILADQDEGGQEDGLQRDNHGEQLVTNADEFSAEPDKLAGSSLAVRAVPGGRDTLGAVGQG